MKIPKHFTIFAQRICVVYYDFIDAGGNLEGEAHHTLNRIRLQPASDCYPQSKCEQTFWHEKLHVVLVLTGLSKKFTEEEVDLLASALHQAQITEDED